MSFCYMNILKLPECLSLSSVFSVRAESFFTDVDERIPR